MHRLRNYYLRCLRVTQYLPLQTKKEIGDHRCSSGKFLRKPYVGQNGTHKRLGTKIGELSQTTGKTCGKKFNTDDGKISRKENSLPVILSAQQINNLLIVCEVGDGLLSDNEIKLLKNILRSLEVCTDILNLKEINLRNIPNSLDDNFLKSVFEQIGGNLGVTSALILGLRNYWRTSVATDRRGTSLNRFELLNGIKIASISDLTTMLREPREKKRAWDILRSRSEIGQTAFNRH